MRRGYLKAKWKRQAETMHRKAIKLADEIEASEGGDSHVATLAQNFHCAAAELSHSIDNMD